MCKGNNVLLHCFLLVLFMLKATRINHLNIVGIQGEMKMRGQSKSMMYLFQIMWIAEEKQSSVEAQC